MSHGNKQGNLVCGRFFVLTHGDKLDIRQFYMTVEAHTWECFIPSPDLTDKVGY